MKTPLRPSPRQLVAGACAILAIMLGCASPGSVKSAAVPARADRTGIAGTWQLTDISTGKADLDQDMLVHDKLRYHFAPDGTGWMENRAGRHDFSWKTGISGETGIRLEYRLAYRERFDGFGIKDQGRTLILRGHFDIDLDNQAEDVVITFHRQS